MKRALWVLTVFLLVFATGTLSLSVSSTPAKAADETALPKSAVTAARFETMLNHNYVFADAFHSVSVVTEQSCLALLSDAEDGVLANTALIPFIKDMYGIDPSVLADEGNEPLALNGTTVIKPRGYTRYTHTVTKITENVDGTFTVYSTVWADAHDENGLFYESVSRFVPAESSRFGYHLLSCELMLTEPASNLVRL